MQMVGRTEVTGKPPPRSPKVIRNNPKWSDVPTSALRRAKDTDPFFGKMAKRGFESVQVVSDRHQRVVAKGLVILPDDRCPETAFEP